MKRMLWMGCGLVMIAGLLAGTVGAPVSAEALPPSRSPRSRLGVALRRSRVRFGTTGPLGSVCRYA